MPIKLIFNINRELMHFIVVNRNVFYSDRKMQAYLQCLPKPEDFIRKIRMSRNRLPAVLTEMFNYTPEEMKEYEAAKDDDAIATIIINDCKLKGATLMLKANVEESSLDNIKIVR